MIKRKTIYVSLTKYHTELLEVIVKKTGCLSRAEAMRWMISEYYQKLTKYDR